MSTPEEFYKLWVESDIYRSHPKWYQLEEQEREVWIRFACSVLRHLIEN
jgi:hypothetical protein